MTKVLLINGDVETELETTVLIEAYLSGAEQAGATVRTIDIAQLQFNPNKGSINSSIIENDLKMALLAFEWADLLVIFSKTKSEVIPTKMVVFFERLFAYKAMEINQNSSIYFISKPLYRNKSARIVTVLDAFALNKWKEGTLDSTYHYFKKNLFQKVGFLPVRSCTVGYFTEINNNYAQKWIRKMKDFGERLL